MSYAHAHDTRWHRFNLNQCNRRCVRVYVSTFFYALMAEGLREFQFACRADKRQSWAILNVLMCDTICVGYYVQTNFG